MNVNRITLSAFGTTGVLLAASLTMLALVSALVTFDAWPTRQGGAFAEGVAVQPGPEASVVRANRTDVPSGAAAERFRELLRDGASVRDALAGARDFGLPGTTRITPGTQLGDPSSVPPAIVPGENPPGCCDPRPAVKEGPDIDTPPPGPLAPVRELVGEVGGGVVPESAGVGDVGARLAP